MKYIFDILRRKSKDAEPYHQRIAFEPADEKETVATALLKINRSNDIRDENGDEVTPIVWETGCLQKKCGACAMLINGSPALACDTFLNKMKPGKAITLAPLGKFPVVADLLTDRKKIFENLKEMELWAAGNADIKEKDLDTAYEASRCLQCGCCLEACPNFFPDGKFFSAAAAASGARLIAAFPECQEKGSGKKNVENTASGTGSGKKIVEEAAASGTGAGKVHHDKPKHSLRENYIRHIYNGCAKALACEKVCPAKLSIDKLMSRSNGAAVWRRHG